MAAAAAAPDECCCWWPDDCWSDFARIAPQLSVQINQMIDKAKHHWCNSRIDKCCSLRLIQRQCNQSLSTMTAAAYSK